MITLQITPDQFAQFSTALERAIDCPFIAEDDVTCMDLERLLGALEGAADAAKVAWPTVYTVHHVNLTNHTMRKIEKLMNAAIKANSNWSLSNTAVVTEDGVSTVRLHGNKIAEIGEDFVRVFDGGWQSNTTKSRLNAIINEFCNAYTDGVFQKQFEWFISDNKVIHEFVNGYTFAEFA